LRQPYSPELSHFQARARERNTVAGRTGAEMDAQ
jgi:hypothetical protein